MKKIILFACVFIVFINVVQAQTVATGGFRRAGTNAQTKTMQRQKLQDSLGLSNDQAKKVDAIQQDLMLKIRAVKMDTQISETERKNKLQQLETERKAKLHEVINDQQFAKMEGQKTKAKKVINKHKKHTAKKQ